MNKPLREKIAYAIQRMRRMWSASRSKARFVAFSTGKDSLAMMAMLYEAVESENEKPVCLYSHHGLEFPENLEYLETIRGHGFQIETVRPFLGYFDLMRRGIGFLTLYDPWCVPMLVGTGFLEWLQNRNLSSPRDAVMFRGMTGSEYGKKYHEEFETYRRLDLPCFNPMLGFRRDEITQIIRERYGLPLNPLYAHMDRSYCICCYTADKRRQQYSHRRFRGVCRRYYDQIDAMLFKSGLLRAHHRHSEYANREEKIDRHGFVFWRRVRSQDQLGALRERSPRGLTRYWIRDEQWINEKHLLPVNGHWSRVGNEIRFWGIQESKTDALVKRMINCMDCGYCVLQCFRHRRFNRKTRRLDIEGCIGCGKCLSLKHCMGWKHRFWRRTLYDKP